MMQYILITLLVLLAAVAHADERPWGVITPFGSGSTNSNGFQGRYNPWGDQTEVQDKVADPAQAKPKRLRQDWQNIYSPRSTTAEDIWPDSQKGRGKGNGRNSSQGRMFGNESLDDGEQWPDRKKQYKPYRQRERFQTPFGTFDPNMMPQPSGVPYGGYMPYRPGY